MEPKVLTQTNNVQHAARLTQLKKIEQNVSQRAAGQIIFSPALITRDGSPIIQRGTVNAIQGGFGSHKSRLAELFCSLLLCPEGTTMKFPLGFEKVEGQSVNVTYIDTERNEKEEFPSAIKSIASNAGFDDPRLVPNFRYTSLKSSDRSNRLTDLQIFINDVRSQTSAPLFVLLDVVTDCMVNFNDLAETMRLLDYIGNLCETYDATFLLIIHENPGSFKARGHLGSESVNKSSTVMHIGFEKGSNGELTDLIMLKFFKQRHSKKSEPVPLIFSQDSMTLQLADPALVKAIADQRRGKAPIEDIAGALSKYLNPVLGQKELISALTTEFGCSPNTIKTRLEEIEQSCKKIENDQGVFCNLKINAQSGKATTYVLVDSPIVELVD